MGKGHTFRDAQQQTEWSPSPRRVGGHSGRGQIGRLEPTVLGVTLLGPRLPDPLAFGSPEALPSSEFRELSSSSLESHFCHFYLGILTGIRPPEPREGTGLGQSHTASLGESVLTLPCLGHRSWSSTHGEGNLVGLSQLGKISAQSRGVFEGVATHSELLPDLRKPQTSTFQAPSFSGATNSPSALDPFNQQRKSIGGLRLKGSPQWPSRW